MNFAPRDEELTQGTDQDCLVCRADDLPRLHVLQTLGLSWQEGIFCDSKGEFTSRIPAEAPLEGSLLTQQSSHVVVHSRV